MPAERRRSARGDSSFRELTPSERMLLMRFVCSFAWADFEVRPEERDLVGRMMRRLELGEEEQRKVAGWLESPPPIESVDPALVPRAHRMKFLRAVESMVAVDGEVTPEERDFLVVFGQLIR